MCGMTAAPFSSLRKFAAAWMFAGSVAASMAAGTSPAQAQIADVPSDPESPIWCQQFPDPDRQATQGFQACPSAPQIDISISSQNPYGQSGSYLLLQDRSGASQACNTTPEFTGDWLAKVGGCGQLCFDFRLIYAGQNPDGSTPTVYPRIAFTSTSGIRAYFIAYNPITMADGWQHICVPIRPLAPGEATLPSNAYGEWRIESAPGAGDFSNANVGVWDASIQNVAVFRLPIDYSPQPSEEAGYDNFCFSPGGCGDKEPPEQSCLEVDTELACLQGQPVLSVTTTAPGGLAPSLIELFSMTAGVSVTPQGAQPYSSPTVVSLSGAQPGQTVTLVANAITPGAGTVEGTDRCCTGKVEIEIPQDCVPADDGAGQGDDGGGDGDEGGDGSPGVTDLSLQKSLSAGPEIDHADGRTHFEWTIEVTNTGTTTVPGAGTLVVRDQIPSGMTVVGTAGTDPGFQCAPIPMTGPGLVSCWWQGGTIAPGAMVGTIRLQASSLPDTDPEILQNCAAVSLLGPDDRSLDQLPGNDQSCATVEPSTARVEPAPPIRLSKHGPSRCTAGRDCNYEVEVQVEQPTNGLIVVEDEVTPRRIGRMVGGNRQGWRCIPGGRGRIVCSTPIRSDVEGSYRLPVTIRPSRSIKAPQKLRQCASTVGYESLPGRLATMVAQERLRELGHYRGAIDGVAGAGTKRAIRAFLSGQGLDGDAGPPDSVTPQLLELLFGPAVRGPNNPSCVTTTVRPLASRKSEAPSQTDTRPEKPPARTCPPLFEPRKDGKGCRPKIGVGIRVPLGGHEGTD